MRYGISAAALIVDEGRLLLVNHQEAGRYDFWLPPGGRLVGDESILDCARREAREETGLDIEAGHILYIQEFAEPGYHFVQFFLLGRIRGGALSLDHRDLDESFLVAARFFAPQELADRLVLPAILKDRFWQDLEADPLPTRYLGLERMRL
jgi:ADP-ribose pyrophosphatase YjhB (NUDIX family)